MGMTVKLTPESEELVRRKVASGLYGSASEVVIAALLLMEKRDQAREAHLRQLRHDIREGLESGDSQVWDTEQFKQQARYRRT